MTLPLPRHFTPFLLVSVALYLGAGTVVLGWRHPEGLGIEAILSLLLPLPVLVFILAWAWAERTLGRRLVPVIPLLAGPRSPAWRRAERLGLGILAGVIGLLTLSPIALALTRDGGLGLAALAPAATWLWLLRVFGLARMRTAVIHMFDIGRDATGAAHQERARDFLTGCVLQARKSTAAKWTIEIKVDPSHLVPVLDAKIQSLPDPDADHDPEILSLSGEDARVLMTWITGNANPYSLVHFTPETLTIDLDPLSAHQKMAALKSLQDARRKTAALFPSKPEQETAQ